MNLNFFKFKKLMKLQANEATHGFTLIELLVVIAIIGILAGIVLTSLGSARDKAKDSSAKASMASMRSEAELGADGAGLYKANLCEALGTGLGQCNNTTGSGCLATLITAVNAQVTPNTVACGQSQAADAKSVSWGAAVELNDGSYYCVDSAGFAGVSTALPTTEIADGPASGDTVCNNT